MPNLDAGTFGDIRKFNKLDPDNPSSTVTLSPIDVFPASSFSNSKFIQTQGNNWQYLRPGDHLLDTGPQGQFYSGITPSRIVSVSEPNQNGLVTIEVEDEQSMGPALSSLVFQPTFIVDDVERRAYDLDYNDFQSKIIYSQIWNAYIGNSVTGQYNETVNLLQYIFSNRHDLETSRELDPTKIGTFSNNVFTPADFFGSSGTFDVRLSQNKVVVASATPVNGPNSAIKFLNAVNRESTGQVKEWRIGFTPNKPIFSITGELTGWQRPGGNGTLITEVTPSGIKNVLTLPKTEMIYLDYHPYETSRDFLGFETGEGWGTRILPFTEDFRIPNPPGSYSGVCSAISVSKNEPIDVEVSQVSNTDLQNLLSTQAVPFEKWTGFTNVDDLNLYLTSSPYFLESESPILLGSGDPTGGQVAVKVNEAYITIFYDPPANPGDPLPGTTSESRFANIQITYKEGSGNEEVTKYIIPVDYDLVNALNSQGEQLITTPNFLISYNSVTIKSWFSEGDQYSTPTSFTSGPGGTGIFEFNAFPLYAFITMKDGSIFRGAEIHNVDLLGNISTFNPQWKYNFIDGDASVTYSAGTNNQTGELNVNGVGSINQTPPGLDDLVPSAFSPVNRLSSSRVDKQGDSLLRPGNTLTTIYINNETKTFDLTDVFGFDRKVITPDIVNTEAVYLVGRSLDNTPVDIQLNLTYVEQL
jgi:hypothetical protein